MHTSTVAPFISPEVFEICSIWWGIFLLQYGFCHYCLNIKHFTWSNNVYEGETRASVCVCVPLCLIIQNKNGNRNTSYNENDLVSGKVTVGHHIWIICHVLYYVCYIIYVPSWYSMEDERSIISLWKKCTTTLILNKITIKLQNIIIWLDKENHSLFNRYLSLSLKF